MAHKTLVNGASYDITGGKTLVNGTAYSIKSGKTLVGGTAYDISFKPPELVVFDGGTAEDYDNITFLTYYEYASASGNVSQWQDPSANRGTITDGKIRLISHYYNGGSYLYMYSPYVWIGPFDFTQYTTLHFNAFDTNSGDNTKCYKFGYDDDKLSNLLFDGITSLSDYELPTSVTEVTCDISNVVGQNYIKACNYKKSTNANLYISKIWLT